MRYRRETPTGDYIFGQGEADFYVDEPGAVGQAVKTRLRLFVGEYFPDMSVGMPWQTQVLGFKKPESYDTAIRDCIAATEGFASFTRYSSSLDSRTRMLTVSARINTIYSNQPSDLTVDLLLTGYNVGGYSVRPYGD